MRKCAIKAWVFAVIPVLAWSGEATPPAVPAPESMAAKDGEIVQVSVKPERFKEYEVLAPKLPDAVFNTYRAKAEQGDPVALDIVYFALRRGCGRKVDQVQAELWREKALNAGGLATYVSEGTRLARLDIGQKYIQRAEAAINKAGAAAGPMLQYWSGYCAWARGDVKTGIERITHSANQGNAWAQAFLGTAYVKVNSSRLPRDFAKAKGWLEKAVEQGVPAAYVQLGELYLNGWGVPMDHRKYDEFVALGAEKGDPDAIWMQSYAQGEQGFELRRKAAEAGNHQAIHAVVNSYMMGSGAKKDEVEAFKWSERLMQDGCTTGYRNVGIAHIKGYGTALDFAKGVEILSQGQRQAYDLNCALQCMLLLSDAYAIAGKNQDLAKAKEWKDRAFAQKEHIAEALFDLGQTCGKGWGLRKSAEEAVKWYRLGAELKHPGCQFKLARCYEFGWAVEKDMARAVELYDLAAKGGWQRGGTPLEKPVLREVVEEEF